MSRLGVDAVHVQQVGAQVWADDEGAGWVGDDLVRVWGVLLRCAAFVVHCVVKGVEGGLVVVEGEFVG